MALVHVVQWWLCFMVAFVIIMDSTPTQCTLRHTRYIHTLLFYKPHMNVCSVCLKKHDNGLGLHQKRVLFGQKIGMVLTHLLPSHFSLFFSSNLPSISLLSPLSFLWGEPSSNHPPSPPLNETLHISYVFGAQF